MLRVRVDASSLVMGIESGDLAISGIALVPIDFRLES